MFLQPVNAAQCEWLGGRRSGQIVRSSNRICRRYLSQLNPAQSRRRQRFGLHALPTPRVSWAFTSHVCPAIVVQWPPWYVVSHILFQSETAVCSRGSVIWSIIVWSQFLHSTTHCLAQPKVHCVGYSDEWPAMLPAHSTPPWQHTPALERAFPCQTRHIIYMYSVYLTGVTGRCPTHGVLGLSEPIGGSIAGLIALIIESNMPSQSMPTFS
jgi:hypothetical protein